MVTKEDLLLSIEKRLKQQENSLKTSIESNKEHLSGEKKVGFLERKQKESIISSKQKQLKQIYDVQRKLDLLNNDTNYDVKNISDETLMVIKDVIGCFSKEEITKIEKTLNSDVKESNKEIISKVEQKGKETTKTVKELNLKNKDMDIYDSETRKINRMEPKRNIEKSMEMVSVMEIQDLEARIKHIDIPKRSISVDESHTFTILEEMIKKGRLADDPKAEKLINNFENIKEAVIKQKKLEELVLQTSSLFLALEQEQGINFSKTIEEIKETVKVKRQEIEECKKITNEIDLEYLNEKANKYLEEKKEKQASGEEKVYEQVPPKRTPEERVRLLTEEYEFEKEHGNVRVYAFYTEYMIYKQQNPQALATYLDFMKVKHPTNTEIIHLLEIKEKRDKTIYAEYLKAKANGEKRTFKEFAEKQFDITKDMDGVDELIEENKEGMSR